MKKWWPLVALATAQFVMVLDQSVMNVSISTLVDDFDTTVTTIQAVITLYCLTMAMFMLTGGKIGDIIGRRKAFVIGLVHLRLRVGPHRRGAHGRRAHARLVDPRRPRCRPGHAGPRRADRRQLRGQGPQRRLRGHRGRGRRRHRDRPDPRRLGHHGTLLAHRLRRRGRAGPGDPRHVGTHPRRRSTHAHPAPGHRRHDPLGVWPRPDRARRAAVQHVGLGQAHRLAHRAVRVLPDPLRHRLRRRPASGPSWPGSGAARPTASIRWCT